MKKKILLVEDEKHLADTISLNLELENFEVSWVSDGPAALREVFEQQFDLIILDIILPTIDGISVCENIRLKNIDIPILFLSAKGSAQDRIFGLKSGGDDYLAKPFLLEELVLRVHKLIYRKRPKENPVRLNAYKFGNCSVDFKNYTAKNVHGEKIQFSAKASMILQLLIINKNKIVERQRILRIVWGYTVFPATRTIDNFILHLRKHFEPNPKKPKYLKVIRKKGYMFVEE